MKGRILILIFCISLAGCKNREYFQENVENPAFRPNLAFHSGEDLTSPKFTHLINKYRLDTIFHGETDEFKRILLLRHWIKTVIAINDFGDPYPGEGNAEGILDAALKGQGFHCGHFMIVQNAVMNAFGYVTRTLGSGPGVKGGPDGHHGINEIWLNQYSKWFLSDAKYDHHFEKNGIPLSALEIRDEYLKNQAKDIVKVKGPAREPVEINNEPGERWAETARAYTWIEWHGYNNMFTAYPEYTELLIMYEDDFFKSHTWIWDNKPHWAYTHPEFMKLVTDRDSIYWTPNTISSNVQIIKDTAKIELISATPNLKSYQMKRMPSGGWENTGAISQVILGGDKVELIFRTLNLAGVTGPEYRILIGSR
jgi:hypothetical protein